MTVGTQQALRIERAGEILAGVRDEWYLVQYFSWLTGARSDQVLLRLTDLCGAVFYNTEDEMNFQYQQTYAARADRHQHCEDPRPSPIPSAPSGRPRLPDPRPVSLKKGA